MLRIAILLLLAAPAYAGKTHPKVLPVAPTTDLSVDSKSESKANAFAGLSQRILGIGGSTAPIPIDPDSPCFVPKNKLGRGQRWLFGAVELSAVAEFDPEVCNVLIEYEREKARRMAVELELMREAKK